LTLLDTHALLWLTEGSPKLGPRARAAADAALAEGDLSVSAISFWEVAMLQAKRRIELTQTVAAWRERVLSMGLQEVPVDGAIGITAVTLEGLHDDPADRLIVATATRRDAVLVTADRLIFEWGGVARIHDART